MSIVNFNIFCIEMLVLIPKYKNNVIVFKRRIDDIFVIWRKQGECDNKFQDFKNALNTISNLHWECEELSETVTFLDLDISINSRSRKFEDKMNVKKEALALHLPLHSAHPSNAARGMVFSLLKNYNANSSNKTSYLTQLNKLLNDLLARGHPKKVIFEIFEEVELEIIEINRRKRNNKSTVHKSTLKEAL